MMKILKSFCLICFLFSCAPLEKTKSEIQLEPITTEDIDVNIDLITIDMAAFNSRLRAKLVRTEKIKDFTIIDSNFYLERIAKYNDPSEVDYVDYIKLKSTELLIKGRMINFVVCTRNLQLRIVLCDNSATSIVDFTSKNLDVDLNDKMETMLSR